MDKIATSEDGLIALHIEVPPSPDAPPPQIPRDLCIIIYIIPHSEICPSFSIPSKISPSWQKF